MTSTRLTKDIRARLAKQILTDRFEEQEGKIWDMFARFAQAVYNDVFSESDRRRMSRLPSGWLPERRDILVVIGGDVERLLFNGCPFGYGTACSRFVERSNVLKMFPENKRGEVLKEYEGGSEHHNHWLKLEGMFEDHVSKVSSTDKEIRSILNTHNTVGALLKTWPEIEKYVRSIDVPTPAMNVPAVRVEELNKFLGLKETA